MTGRVIRDRVTGRVTAQWADLAGKADARLESPFSTVTAVTAVTAPGGAATAVVADFDFDTFDEVLLSSPLFASRPPPRLP